MSTHDISTRRDILQGMASAFWATAWAEHIENHGCYRVSGGSTIEDHMPPIPEEAYQFAGAVSGKIALLNRGEDIVSLWEDADAACEEDFKHCESRRHSPEDFGGCLAMMFMGAGVSWDDSHSSDGEPKVPHGENDWRLTDLVEQDCALKNQPAGPPSTVPRRDAEHRFALGAVMMSPHKSHKVKTLKEARDVLAERNLVITKRDGEYRVNIKGGREGTAYYTTDLQDAVDTGIQAANKGVW